MNRQPKGTGHSGPLCQYVLGLGDDSLILGQRLAEWLGHAPAMELDIACANLSLDLIGQAQLYYNYAAELEGEGRTADDLAFLRDAFEFRNHLLVEQPNGDFGKTIVRHYLYMGFQCERVRRLAASTDPRIAEIAAKSAPELEYHDRFASDWFRRLALGSDEGNRRVRRALDDLWQFGFEFFEDVDRENDLYDAGVLPRPSDLKETWTARVKDMLGETGLSVPESVCLITKGRNAGHHTEHLGHLLAEMQFLQRAYPGAAW